ncbi:MAG: hypothetical protein IKT62_03975, partial [Firmicutes bacterium]|nr:hypothetical protein [Bacillota bacterium]
DAKLPEKHPIDCGCTTYKEHVQYLIQAAIKLVNDEADKLASDSNIAAYKTAKTKGIDASILAYGGETAKDSDTTHLVVEKGYEATASGSTDNVGLGIYELNANLDVTVGSDTAKLETYKTTYVEGEAASSAANVASVKAAIAQAYADYIKENTKTSDKAYADNVKKVLDFLAEEKVDLTGHLYAWYFNTGNVSAATVAATIANVETFEAEAAKLAAQKDVNGALVRDAEDVADLVTEGTIIAYAAAASVIYTSEYTNADGAFNEISDCYAAISALYVGLGDAELAFVKALRAEFVAELLADFEENATYYPAELDKIKAIFDEYVTKVNAITDITDITKYDSAYIGTIATGVYEASGSKLDLVKTAAEIALEAYTTGLQSTAQSYLDLVNGQITKTANKYYEGTSGTSAKLNELVADLVGNSGLRTAKEVETLAEQALALAKSLPTNAAQEAALDAADDAKDALPDPAKIADKALVDAAIAAADAYYDLTAEAYPSAAAVEKAAAQYAYAYNTELVAKVKAVSATDKAAIEAILDEVDAFVETYEDEVGTGVDLEGVVFKAQTDILYGYLADIQAAEVKKVTEAIAAIPVTSNITEAARPAVEAARAAYDAYVAAYTDTTDYDYVYTTTVTTDGFAADDVNVGTLFTAEAALGLEAGVNTFDDVDAKAYIQDLAVKARSVKTAKGNVKVTVVADVDVLVENGYTVEYKFYRSTKSNKGFQLKKTSEEATYTNTSGKKGTKYFYKAVIVVKDAEGEVVAKTPLKHCLYASRTWSK